MLPRREQVAVCVCGVGGDTIGFWGNCLKDRAWAQIKKGWRPGSDEKFAAATQRKLLVGL